MTENNKTDADTGKEGQMNAPRPRHNVDRKLLELLVCPLTKSPLDYDAKTNELISRQARLAYPIRDGIPVMLVDEARPLDDEN